MGNSRRTVYWSQMRGKIVEGEILVMGNRNLATVLKTDGRWQAHAGCAELNIPEFSVGQDPSSPLTKDEAKYLAFAHVRKALSIVPGEACV